MVKCPRHGCDINICGCDRSGEPGAVAAHRLESLARDLEEVADLRMKVRILEMLLDRGKARILALEATIDRLRQGQFTEVEFQNLCHGLVVEQPDGVCVSFSQENCRRFVGGCLGYWRSLFGDETVREVVYVQDALQVRQDPGQAGAGRAGGSAIPAGPGGQ